MMTSNVKAVKSTLTDLTDTVGGAVGDALSAGSHLAHDVAATTADRASGLAATAAHQVPEIQGHVADIVDSARRSARRRLGRPAPRRRRPWLAIGAVAVALIAVGVVLRRRRHDPVVDRGVEDGSNPVRGHTERAVAAAGH